MTPPPLKLQLQTSDRTPTRWLLELSLILVSITATAQEAAFPAATASPSQAEAAPTLVPAPAAPTPATTPTPLEAGPAIVPVPSPTPILPELSALDQAFNQTGLGKDADEMRMRVEMRKLQNEAANDPAVIAAKAAANAAPTDLEKRERLRDYYEINYGLMSKRASSSAVRSAIEQSKKEHIAMLSQPRVRPGSGEAPAPTPKKKKHKSGKKF